MEDGKKLGGELKGRKGQDKKGIEAGKQKRGKSQEGN